MTITKGSTIRPLRHIATPLTAGAVAALLVPAAAAGAAAPAMTVAVKPATGGANSYFRMSARPGLSRVAGVLELRNREARRIRVTLDPVGGLTASTLGSAYATTGARITGPAAWTRVSLRRVTLRPNGRARVRVSVRPPAGTRPGDYLSGLSVQAVRKPAEQRLRGNVAIASVQRYAVGVMVRLPGARKPHLDLTGATVTRESSAVTFQLKARNSGNAILQNVRGRVLVTSGRRVVARGPLGPGTFVTGTSIAYPVPAPRESPRPGAIYRVRAHLEYKGGTARLDEEVRFGRVEAKRQESLGGPVVAPSPADRGPLLKLAAALAAAIGGMAALALLLVRLRRRGEAAARRTLGRALLAAHTAGTPLSVLRIPTTVLPARRLLRLVRPQLRRGDRVFLMRDGHLLAVLPGLDWEVADALAAELEGHLVRPARGAPTHIEVLTAERGATVDDLLGLEPETIFAVPEPAPQPA